MMLTAMPSAFSGESRVEAIMDAGASSFRIR